jgi:hypothetical protein
MLSAILHDCPKQAVQDLSCSKATLVRSLVRNRRRSPLGSFLTATTSLPSGRSCCIFYMIASFSRLCTLFLSSVSEMRIVSSGPSIEGTGDFGGVGGREVAIRAHVRGSHKQATSQVVKANRVHLFALFALPNSQTNKAMLVKACKA